MEPIPIVEIPDRLPTSGNKALNRRLTAYLARRAAGQPAQHDTPSNVTFRPLTPEERAEREARLRSRQPEKRQAAYAYKRSAVEAYQPKPQPKPQAAAAAPDAPSVPGSRWPHPKRRAKRVAVASSSRRRMRRSQRPTKVDLNRDLNGMIRNWLGI